MADRHQERRLSVGIHNEPSGSCGGSEYVVSVMAHAMSGRHDVEIVHHNPTLTRAQLAELSGLDLEGVTLRYVVREELLNPRQAPGFRKLLDRWRAEREWQAGLSRPYDVFLTSTHRIPPFCHAPTGVLLTLFPTEDRKQLWPWVMSDGQVMSRFQRAWRERLWQTRFSSYRHRLSISEYSRKWTRTLWGVETGVLYPPVDTRFADTAKSNIVLSVGRFSTHSHSKRQLETMSAFCGMKDGVLRNWCYFSVGGLTDAPGDRQYFDDVSRVAADCGARVVPNIPRDDLRSLYAKARIFWHAAGYGAGADTHPFDAEHFGIATVEAMAAGAVPVVYDHGGQSEIVEHERSGYLWTTLDELREFTRRLVVNEELRRRMADAARRRAAHFSRETFVNAVQRLVS